MENNRIPESIKKLNGRYFSTHNHTPTSNYRLLDCINNPEELFARAVEIGLSGFAVTDHEALSAHVEIMEIRDRYIKEGKITDDFTVTFGNEAYLVDSLEMGISYYHWLLLAIDEKGHEILRKLSTQAWENSYKDRGMERVPITKAQVEKIMEENDGKGHLIATSACLGGELGKNALEIRDIENNNDLFFKEIEINKRKKKMEDYVLWNQRVFGKENFYIELAPNDKADQRYSNNMLKDVAKAYDAKLIFATDSHYLTKEDQPIHRAFLHSKEGEREVDAFYSTAYMMDLEEVWEYFSLDFSEDEFLIMLNNLEDMRQRMKHYSLFREQEIPMVDVNVPEVMFPVSFDGQKYPFLEEMLLSSEEQDVYWSRTCLNELFKRQKWNEKYIGALELEAETLVKISDKMGQSMASYYNTAQVLVQLMWHKANSLVGISRGSALSFLSNWLLDITQIDPLPFGIPYWRHLSEDRPELPDIDFDSEGFRREAVINAVKDYFGEDRVLNIVTYGTEGTKSAIATACRGLDIDNDIALYLSGLVPNERGFDWSLSDMINGNEEKDRKPIHEFKKAVAQHDKLLETAMRIEGMVTKRGSHASGVYIFNHDYTETNAMMKAPNGLKVTQWNMNESDKMGGLKFDFLSIEALDKIHATMDLLIKDNLMEDKGDLKSTYDHYLHPDNMDYSESLWKPAWEGKVLDLFQFQTPVGGEAIKKGKPETVIEAAAVNSLMRLMPLNGEAPTDKFARMKENIQLWYEELNTYGIEPNEVKILERHYLQSYGVPNTQEELDITLAN